MTRILDAARAAALATLLCAAPLHAQSTWTVSSWVPPSHLLYQDVVVPWTKDVEAATAGRVKFNFLPKAVANPPGTFDAIRDGLADVSLTVHGYTPGRFVLTKLAEMPFLGDKSEQISVAYQRIYERYLETAGEHRGVKVIAVFTHGPGYVYNTRKAVATVQDMAGMKIRVGGGVVNDVARVLGASALLRPSTESYEIISSGVADGLLFPAESVVAFKLEKLIRHETVVPGGLYNTSFVMFMNEAAWNKLSKADQDAVAKVSGEKVARAAGRAWDARDESARKGMAAAGVATVTADARFIAEVKKRTAEVEEGFYKEATARGWDGKRFLAEFRAEVRKVQGGDRPAPAARPAAAKK